MSLDAYKDHIRFTLYYTFERAEMPRIDDRVFLSAYGIKKYIFHSTLHHFTSTIRIYAVVN